MSLHQIADQPQETNMTQTQTEPSTQLRPDREPKLHIELVKDLDLDNSQVEQVRGGQSGGATKPSH